MTLLIMVVVILILFGAVGWGPSYSRYGYWGGGGLLGFLLLVLLILWLAGLFR